MLKPFRLAYLFFIFLHLPLPHFIHASDQCSYSSPHIEYSFLQRESDPLSLKILLKFQGNATGQSKLHLPHKWGSENNLYECIYDLRSSNAQLLESENPEIKEIHYSPKDQVFIEYSVRLVHDKDLDLSRNFKPHGTESYFFANGNGLFIIPDSSNKQSQVILNWEGLPSDWLIANGFGVNQRVQDLWIPLEDLHRVGFSAGNDLRAFELGNSSSLFLVLRKNAIISENELIQYINTITQSQQDFWNEQTSSPYLITIFPFEKIKSFSGIALKNSFHLLFGEYDNPLEILRDVLSHEYFHNWNGTKIRFSEPEGSMYWFTEGFTDYFSLKINYQNGLITSKDYVKKLNSIFQDYYASPAFGITNEDLTKCFWDNSIYRRLPYVKGCSLAFILDSKIINQSKGYFSLDNLMRDIYCFVQNSQSPLSIHELYSLFNPYLSKKDMQALKQSLQGSAFPFDTNLLEDEYEIVWKDFFGFNLKKSIEYGYICGIEAHSIADTAGLQNNMKLLNFVRNGATLLLTVQSPKTASEHSFTLVSPRQIPQLKKRKK